MFNRLMYDKCEKNKKDIQNDDRYVYNMMGYKFQNTRKCRIEYGTVGGSGLVAGNLVDLESDLFGQNTRATRCPVNKFVPKCLSCDACAAGLPCGCRHCKARGEGLPVCSQNIN